MGGDQSQPQKYKHQEHIHKKQILNPLPDLNQDDHQNKIIPQNVDQSPKHPFSNLKENQKPIKIKKTKAKYKQKVHLQNSIKMRKGEEIIPVRRSPSETFFSDKISNICRSRLDLFLDPFKGEPLKPVVEYGPHNRGAILLQQSRKIDNWNRLIAGQSTIQGQKVKMIESYISINDKHATQFKLRQIKKRLSDLKKGEFESGIDEYIFEDYPLINV